MPRRIQTPHQIFNSFDELALLVSLERDPYESNADFKERLAGFWANNPNSSRQGLIGALSSEFGLGSYNTIDKRFFWLSHRPIIASGVTVYLDEVEQTPQLLSYETTPEGWEDIPNASGLFSDADDGWIIWQRDDGLYSNLLEFVAAPTGSYVTVEYSFEEGGRVHTIVDGDQDLDLQDPIYGLDGIWKCYAYQTPDPTSHVVVNSLNDEDYLYNEDNGLVDGNGLPTQLLKRIVALMQEASPISWGRFVWDEAYYQDDPESIETLPSLYDADISGYVTEGTTPDFQSGVGGDSQLLIVDVVEKAGTGATEAELHPTGAIY